MAPNAPRESGRDEPSETEAAMKRKVTLAASGALLSVALGAGTALAALPANPGCFGTDRAAVFTASTGGPRGASEIGMILVGRAGDNAEINRAYLETVCGIPAGESQ
jgi:hypothetical protein